MAEGEGTPLEIGGVNDFLGVQADSLEDFKTNFESTFIRRDNVKLDADLMSQMTGKKMGLAESDIRGVFKAAGLPLDDLDTKGKKLHELVHLGLSTITDKHAAQVSELEEVTLKSKDDAYKDLESKFERSNKKYLEEKELRETTVIEFSNYKEESANRFKGNTISTLRQQAFNNATFKSGISDLEMEGFKARISSNYKSDLDDNGGLVVTDTEGARIPNPATSGTFMTFDDVLRAEAINNKLYPLNDTSGGKKVTHQSLRDVESTGDEKPSRKVNRSYRG